MCVCSVSHLLFFYFLAALGLSAACGLPVGAASGGCSLVTVHRHLTEVAFLVVGHRLQAHGLSNFLALECQLRSCSIGV